MKLRSSRVYGPDERPFDTGLLKYFKQMENNEALEILRKNKSLLKSVDHQGCSLLHHAVKSCNLYMTQYLINSRINVNIQDLQGKSALMLVQSQSLGANIMIDTLLKANAYVHLRDVEGKSVLQIICEDDFQSFDVKVLYKNLIANYSKDNEKIVKLFLECKNPLRRLIWAEQPMLTRALLKHGYPVDEIIYSHTRKTALHIAVECNDLEHVKFLIEFGANVNAKSKCGSTPLFLFNSNHRRSHELLQILLDNGASTTKLRKDDLFMPIQSALLHTDREGIKLLRQKNINFQAKDVYNQTVLHLLSMNNCKYIFNELDGIDFDLEAKDFKKRRTPLHYAIGNSSSVEFLLEKGADPNAIDVDGLTPLHAAFRLDNDYNGLGIQCEFNIRTVELLLEYGANPQAVSSYGRTVLEEAGNKYMFVSIKPIIAHLAMIEARGDVIQEIIREQINNNNYLTECFDFCIKKLEELKTVEISKCLTLCDLLTKSEDELEKYMRNRILISNISLRSKKCVSGWKYYLDLIQRRVEKIVRKIRNKDKAATIVDEMMVWNYEASHIILDKIINYLNYKDISSLLELKNT